MGVPDRPMIVEADELPDIKNYVATSRRKVTVLKEKMEEEKARGKAHK
jgi:hypothetical protein